MKAIVALAVLLIAIVVAWIWEPAAIASSMTVSRGHSVYPPEPVWMVLSGVTLIALGSAVRRLTS